MFIVFFDIKEIACKKIVAASHIINSTFYCDVLRRLREHMRRHRPGFWQQKHWLLNDEHAAYNISLFTTDFSTINNIIVVSLIHSNLLIWSPASFLCSPEIRCSCNAADFTRMRWPKEKTHVVLL